MKNIFNIFFLFIKLDNRQLVAWKILENSLLDYSRKN